MDIEEHINLRGSASSLREIEKLAREVSNEIGKNQTIENLKLVCKLARIEGIAKGGAGYLEDFVIPHLEKDKSKQIH